MIEILFILVILTGSTLIVVTGREDIPFNAREAAIGRETSKEVRRKRNIR